MGEEGPQTTSGMEGKLGLRMKLQSQGCHDVCPTPPHTREATCPRVTQMVVRTMTGQSEQSLRAWRAWKSPRSALGHLWEANNLHILQKDVVWKPGTFCGLRDSSNWAVKLEPSPPT